MLSKIGIVDYRMPVDMQVVLQKKGLHLIQSTPCQELLTAIDGHPDMVLHSLGEQKVVVAPNVWDYYGRMLEPLGIDVIRGENSLVKDYPKDIAYNVLRIENKAFHYTRYTDSMIVEQYERRGVELISVKQGYSKCSVCVINEKTAISSDKKMAEILCNQGIKTLYVETKDILLPGMSCGFFGGATGMLDEKTLALCGRLKSLQDHEKIKKFLDENEIQLLELSQNQVTDFGSILIL